jgi:poly(A) polymerase
MTRLPLADWMNRPALQRLCTVLGSSEGLTRYVGGAVRDTVLGLPVKDIDLATRLTPAEVMDRLQAADVHVVPTGLAHGTVTAVTQDGPVEITTLRRDVATDGRRALVAFSEDWREDAARRDFTINALSADPDTRELFDYFGGEADLAERHIRFIGDPDARIAEDYLRIMRYFRFLARFGGNRVDAAAFAACQSAAPHIATLSRERVADELLKLLGVADPRFAVAKMVEGGILHYVLTNFDPHGPALLDRLQAREQSFALASSPVCRLAALLPKDREQAAQVAAGLKLSNKIRKALASRVPAAAASPHCSDTGERLPPAREQLEAVEPDTIRGLAYRLGLDAARDQALLYGGDADVAAMMDLLNGWTVPTFPIKGGDLVAMGMPSGPMVAKTLAAIEQDWIAEGFPDRPRAEALALAAVEKTIQQPE